MANDSRWKNAGKAFRAEGLAFSIPMVLVTFPVAGAFLGKWTGQYLEMPALLYIGLLAGLVLGIRECVRLVRLLNKVQQ